MRKSVVTVIGGIVCALAISIPFRAIMSAETVWVTREATVSTVIDVVEVDDGSISPDAMAIEEIAVDVANDVKEVTEDVTDDVTPVSTDPLERIRSDMENAVKAVREAAEEAGFDPDIAVAHLESMQGYSDFYKRISSGNLGFVFAKVVETGASDRIDDNNQPTEPQLYIKVQPLVSLTESVVPNTEFVLVYDTRLLKCSNVDISDVNESDVILFSLDGEELILCPWIVNGTICDVVNVSTLVKNSK